MKLFLALAVVALVGSAIARPARDAKSDLIAKANDLVKKADDAVTKLTADKKDHEATVIKTQEAHIKKLIEDLTAATADAQVRRLEMELTQADNRLTHELARVNQTPGGPTRTTQAAPEARDLKSDLTTKGNDLVTKIDEAITKLTTDKRDHEVTLLKGQETQLKKLIEDLTAATDDAKVRQLERQLTGLEARLTHELTRIDQIKPQNPPTNPSNPTNPVTRDAKSDLIAKANDLVKKADDAVTKLTADKKDHEATIIKTQEAHIKKLIEDLTAATADAQVRRLEMELTQADNRLTHELARVNQTPGGPTRTTQATPTNE